MKLNIKPFVAGFLSVFLLSIGTLALAESARMIEGVFGKVQVELSKMQVVVAGQPVGGETLLYDGTTYIPLRAVANAFDMDVAWDEESSTVYIVEPARENQTETQDISMSVKKDSLSAKEAILTINNFTGNEWTYGDHYKIERKDGNGWTAVDTVIENYAFNDIGYILPENAMEEHHIQWEWLYGALPHGEYRIVKDFLYVRAPGNYDTFPVSCEFIIQ